MGNLIFVDCETTGLNEVKDHIVELALVAVELPTFTEVAHFTSVIAPPLWPTVQRNLQERVLQMHTASGLMALIDAAYDAEVCSYPVVERQARAFIREHSPRTAVWQSPMAGANPDFDRRFLRSRMPLLHADFHYRNYDVRSLTQLQDWFFGTQHVESPHRALPDARKAVADVRAFLGVG